MKRIALFVAAAALMCGCSTDGSEVESAVKACAEHGGVTELTHDLFSSHAKCMDGSLFLRVGQAP